MPAALVLTLGLALLLVAPALFRPESRPWALGFLALLLLALAVLSMPALSPPGIVLHWNWSGMLALAAVVAWAARSLVAAGALTWAEMGVCWRQRPGSLGPALAVSAAALALHGLALTVPALAPQRSGLPSPGIEGWLYQAMLPGLVEEMLFRGLLLALLARAFTRRWQLLGVSVGWGAGVVTLVFVALHGLHAAGLIGVLPAALLYLWLRLSTGSLLLPVLVHNAWNLVVLAAA